LLLGGAVGLTLKPILVATSDRWAVEDARERKTLLDPWGRSWCTRTKLDRGCDGTGYPRLVRFLYSAGPDGVDQRGAGDDLGSEPRDDGDLRLMPSTLADLQVAVRAFTIAGAFLRALAAGPIASACTPRSDSVAVEVRRAGKIALAIAPMVALPALLAPSPGASPFALDVPHWVVVPTAALGSFVGSLGLRLSRPVHIEST
jgi:hypothetical protein